MTNRIEIKWDENEAFASESGWTSWIIIDGKRVGGFFGPDIVDVFQASLKRLGLEVEVVRV